MGQSEDDIPLPPGAAHNAKRKLEGANRSNTGNDPKRAKASGGMTREERLTRMKREMRKYFDEHVLTDGGESTSVEEAAQKNEEVFAKGAEVDKVVNSKEFEKEIADMRLRALYIADEEYSLRHGSINSVAEWLTNIAANLRRGTKPLSEYDAARARDDDNYDPKTDMFHRFIEEAKGLSAEEKVYAERAKGGIIRASAAISMSDYPSFCRDALGTFMEARKAQEQLEAESTKACGEPSAAPATSSNTEGGGNDVTQSIETQEESAAMEEEDYSDMSDMTDGEGK